MTRARLIDSRSVVAVAALAALVACELAILHSAAFARGTTVISAAIAFDLSVTSAALVWWLGVRRAGWPRWTIGATAAGGLALSRAVLPGSVVMTGLIAAWLAVEATAIVLAVGRIRRVIRVARAHPGPGPVAKVEAGLLAARTPARFAGLIATDVVALGLGLGGWFRRAPRGPDLFAMHRRKSWTAIVLVLIGLVAAETLAVHVVVAHWSPIAAWIITATSIYAAVWLAADLHALRLYPLRVTADDVLVSIGLRWRIAIPRAAIASVARVDAVPDGALAATVVEPTLVITLAHPIEVRGVFGIRRMPSAIALTVDEPERLIARLASHG